MRIIDIIYQAEDIIYQADINDICVGSIIGIVIVGLIYKIITMERDRAKGLRRIFFPFVGQISFALILLIGSFLGILNGIKYVESKLHYLNNDLTSFLLSIMILLLLIRITFKIFLLSVPAFVGLVTENLLGGEYFTYSTGIHIKYPWEVAKIENYFSLELITVPFVEDFVSKDGGVVRVRGSFRYRADFDSLIQYAQIDESTIVIGFSNLVKRLITSEIAKRSADQARKETDKIKEVIEELHVEKDGKPKLTSKDEKHFGVQFEDFTLADIGYDDKTQNILTADFNRKVLAGVDKDGKPREFNDMNPKAREDAMI